MNEVFDIPTDLTIRAELEQLNFGQLMKFHEIYRIELPSVELNKRRLIRNIESSLLEDSKYLFPELNIPKGKVGIFWNNPDYKINISCASQVFLEVTGAV